jgi:hypothetical protein
MDIPKDKMTPPAPYVRKAVDAGQYYPKRTDNTWLRRVLRRHGHRITYADVWNIGECDIDTFARFTDRGPLTVHELEAHAAEIAKIEAVIIRAISFTAGANDN